MPRDSYYANTINQLLEGKDSIVEMAKVLDYDTEKMVASIFTLTSHQYKNDVPVFFSSMFLNTGIISPPVKHATVMILWGPDRQPYMLPSQYNLPNIEVNEGKANLNASPGYFDHLLSLKNIQGGEHLLRSLNGAYVFLKNLGDVEIGTSRLHRLSLIEKDGALDAVLERVRIDAANSYFYLGPASMDSKDDPRTHFYFEMDENAVESVKLEDLDDQALIDEVLKDSPQNIEVRERDKFYKSQKGHVFDTNGSLEVDFNDGTELFSKEEMRKGDTIYTEELSKGARKVFKSTNGGVETEVILTPNKVEISRVESQAYGSSYTSISLNEKGQIMCGKDGEEFDIFPMLKWFYEQRD